MLPRIDLINGFNLKGQIINLAIKQGATYQLTLVYPEDLRGGYPISEIRTDYRENAPEELPIAKFRFLPFIYDSINNKTTVTLQLDAQTTLNLPSTTFQADDTQKPTQSNCYIYDLFIKFSRGVVKNYIPPSFIQVVPNVTITD